VLNNLSMLSLDAFAAGCVEDGYYEPIMADIEAGVVVSRHSTIVSAGLSSAHNYTFYTAKSAC
jgi:hypothetical protein